MIKLIEKTNQYIDNLNENETNKLLEKINDIYLVDMNIKKEWIHQYITFNYLDYSSRDEIIEREIKSESVNAFIMNNPNQKLLYAFELYKEAKFSDSATIGTYLKKLGVNYKYQNHFVEKKDMEDALFKIIQSGVLINYAQWMLTIDLIYDIRIYKEFQQKLINSKKVEKYDKRDNVYELEIQMINIIRKKKYASSKPQKMNEFEFLMLGLDTKNSEIDVLKLLKESLTKKNRKEIKKYLKLFLDPIVENKGRVNAINIFKDYFHILFENNSNGLLTEETFEIENQKKPYEYDGNYMNYYSTRIETLVGI